MRAGLVLSQVTLLLSLLWGTAASGSDERPSLTLESIFASSEFQNKSVQNVQWSRDGSSFTYTAQNEGSTRLDIREHEVASGVDRVALSGEMLTHNGKPIELSGYQWTNDRRFLVASGPQTLTWDSVIEAPHYIYDARSKKLLPLADGNASLRNVHLSPDGRHVGYVLENDIYISELPDGKTRAVTTDGSPDVFNGIFDYGSRMFGFTDAWHWSPDGTKIAFWRLDVSDVKVFYMIDELGKYNTIYPLKYPNTGERHAVNRIGVYDLRRGRITWVDTGNDQDDYIPQIAWTRSSDTLAVQRLTRNHQRLDLLMADAASGDTKVVVTDHDPAWIDITTDLRFFAGQDRFVWTSEKSGYRHAYLYDYEGNETQLTSGDWEITALIAVDESGDWLYFYSKKDSFIDQHVYGVRLSGSDVEKVSGEPGWYEWNSSPDGKHVIETWSNAATPPVTRLRHASGKDIRTLEENDVAGLQKYAVPNPEFFEIETTDGIVLNASMIKPLDFDPDRTYPAIGYGYGNAGSQVVVNRWGDWRGPQRDLWHRFMAQQGFIVYSLDNRTTAGRGKAAKNLTYGHYAKYAVHDQLEGVQYLKSLSYVDPTRVGFWGWSGGGYLACALMTKGAPHFKTGVSVAPVIDLSRYQAVGVERWMGFLDENEAGYQAVNLINDAHKLQGDLLLIHGTGDENVKFAFTLQFADSLIKQNKQFDMMVYPNQHHGIEDARLHVYTKMANYFLEKL
jgi:dipeptidyl-peptidase 4